MQFFTEIHKNTNDVYETKNIYHIYERQIKEAALLQN